MLRRCGIRAHYFAVQKVFAVVLALVVGFAVVGCEKPADSEVAVKVVEEVVCEMVVPVVDAVLVKMKAGVTVTAALIAAVTGIVLSKACAELLDRIGADPDEEHEVTLDNGKGSETTKISGNTFTSVTQDWCNRTGGCTGFDRCPTSYICLFTGNAGAGKMSLFKSGSPDLGGQHIDAATVSVYNRTGQTATLFDEYKHQGESHTVTKGAKTDLPAAWQARAASLIVGPVPTSTPVTTTTTSTAPSSSTTKPKPTDSGTTPHPTPPTGTVN